MYGRLQHPTLSDLAQCTTPEAPWTQTIVANNIERRGITRIVFAHRASTIRNAGQIDVINDGAVVEQGTFKELSSTSGDFNHG